MVNVGGAAAPLSLLSCGAFAFIRTMSRCGPSVACRPFDRNRDGFVMGEGAASLILEEYEHAKARGAHIYGEVLGYSLNNDRYHMTSPLPSGDSCIRAIVDALNAAQIIPEQIDSISGHAGSTPLIHPHQLACMKKI